MRPTIEQLIAEDKLEHVQIDSSVPERELAAAWRHHKTAKLAAEEDPEGAFQLLYDSARKALQAVLFTKGLRVRKPPRGNHFTYVLVTRTDLVDDEVWAPFNWMRELRNTTEYWEPGKVAAGSIDVLQALGHVSRMLNDAQIQIEGFSE
jgi:hypothetical protein